MNSEELLVIKYEDITENLINSLKKDDLESFYDLIEQRELLICELKKASALNFTEDFKKELKLVNLEKELKELIANKLREYKLSMDMLAKNKEAHNAYTDYFKKRISFNTKV